MQFSSCRPSCIDGSPWKSHKRNGPVQCTARIIDAPRHTSSYCVACGDFHNSLNCPANKEDPQKKKCGNCRGIHTANYMGCVVYKELKSRMRRARYWGIKWENFKSIYKCKKNVKKYHLIFRKCGRDSFVRFVGVATWVNKFALSLESVCWILLAFKRTDGHG